MLDRIVGEALSLSGRLQKMAAEARPPSLADLASERMLHHLSSLNQNHQGASGAASAGGTLPVAILGVSPMTRRAADLLHKAGVPLLIGTDSRGGTTLSGRL